MQGQRRSAVLSGTVLIALLGVVTVLAQDAPGTTTPSAAATASPAASPVGTPSGALALVGDVEAGKLLATQCIGCHTTDGTVIVGPSWKGIFGETVELEDGSTVVVDEAYIEHSIRAPLSQIVKGFPPAMPPYTTLTDQQVADLIAYIKSLGEEHDESED